MDERGANAAAWDRLARGSAFARVASDAELQQPLLALDTRGWLPGRVDGLDVLCLAAGGGWQSILYAAAGARVTVVDLSDGMLELDRREATRRGLEVEVVKASMDALPLEGGRFDIVHQPVSTCYVRRLQDVYAEVARVIRPGGLYISQHKTPTSVQVTDDRPDRVELGVEYERNDPLPRREADPCREAGCVEYLHRWHDLVGGLCRAGFVIEDCVEPRWADAAAAPGTIGHRSRFARPYVRLKARRLEAAPPPSLWVPGTPSALGSGIRGQGSG